MHAVSSQDSYRIMPWDYCLTCGGAHLIDDVDSCTAEKVRLSQRKKHPCYLKSCIAGSFTWRKFVPKHVITNPERTGQNDDRGHRMTTIGETGEVTAEQEQLMRARNHGWLATGMTTPAALEDDWGMESGSIMAGNKTGLMTYGMSRLRSQKWLLGRRCRRISSQSRSHSSRSRLSRSKWSLEKMYDGQKG